MAEPTRTFDAKVIFALALVHFIGDFYISFISPLLPVFVEKFSLTLTQVGLVTGITNLLAFIVQPSAGYLADRYRTRIFVLGGPLLAIVFISLVGIAPSFAVLIILVAWGSVGVSMFHPTVAGMVHTYSGRHFGLALSIFNTGGTLAFGAGPLFITFFVTAYGLERSPYIMALGLAGMVLLFKIVPLPRGEGLKHLGFFGSLKEMLGGIWKSILLIWVIIVVRVFVSQSFLTFIPVFYAREGYSLVSIGTMISLYTMGGAISGIFAGHMSDRMGRKPIFYLAYGLTTPSLYFLLFVTGNWIYLGAALAGFFVMATLPLGVAMAQELAPRGRSMVSSLMMGLAFGTGGMMTPLTGKLADMFSLRPVLCFLAIIPLLATSLISLLPEKIERAPFPVSD